MWALGIGGLLHDGAAALLHHGEVVAAIEEEKLSRRPHGGGLPQYAIDACLDIAGVDSEQLDCVVLARPLGAPEGSPFHLHVKSLFPKSRIVIADHHVAHAAAAFYPSPFEQSKVLTLDRRGDMRSGAWWNAEGPRLSLVDELYASDSPAAFYSRVTELLGFRADREEHKVQWLSRAGGTRFVEPMIEMMGGTSSTRPQVDHSYFDPARNTRGGFSDRFFKQLGISSSDRFSDEVRADLASGLQSAVEAVFLRMVGEGENLCLGGGLAMNSLLIEAVERSGKFKNVWVQPVAGNAGTAIGCAFHAWHHVFRQSERKPLGTLCLGPSYDREQVKRILENCKLRFQYLMTTDELIKTAVGKLDDHQIVAWFQGRMEFGPRALGNRSILASPLNPYSTENLNVYIKHREPFRKFAASVPEELASEYFDCGTNARHLATVSRVREPHLETFKAALLDGDRIRVHAVCRDDNPLYWSLLHAAGQSSGMPVLFNTSFNLFDEPLVSDPRAALRSFYGSGIDSLFVNHFLLEK